VGSRVSERETKGTGGHTVTCTKQAADRRLSRQRARGGSGRRRGTVGVGSRQEREREAGGSGPEIAQHNLIINSGPSHDIQLPRVGARQAEQLPNVGALRITLCFIWIIAPSNNLG
jgi:hypothetical protein